MPESMLRQAPGHGQLIDNEGVYQQEIIMSGTAMCFDFGEQRIGVAVGEHLIGQAQALTAINNESNSVRFNCIETLVAEWQPKLLLVGLPLNLAGEETPITQLCTKFARRLNGRFNLPVMMIDERYSSVAASEILNQAGLKGRAQKSQLDQVAAQTILQSYFDSMQT